MRPLFHKFPPNPNILPSSRLVTVLLRNGPHWPHAGDQVSKTVPGLQGKILGTTGRQDTGDNWVLPVTVVRCAE